MGELASVDLHDTHNKGCSKCGMPVKGNCCKDEAKFVKLDNSHQAAKAYVDFTTSITMAPVVMEPVWLQPLAPTPVLNAWAPLHGPPLSPAVPLYMSHCIFLI